MEDNVWPFIDRDDKLHYDCSKLDQWATVFEHGTHRGMYLHFKMQETENDDHNRGRGKKKRVPESLDGGDLGPQRKLYCRELIARFGHNLALNWNLGEENTQSLAQQQAFAKTGGVAIRVGIIAGLRSNSFTNTAFPFGR